MREPRGRIGETGIGERWSSSRCEGIVDVSIRRDRRGGLVLVPGENLVVGVPSHVANCERGVRSDLLLNAQAPGNDGRRGDIGLYVARRNLGRGRWRHARREIQTRYRNGLDGLGSVEWSGLIAPIVERVKQAVVEADTSADGSCA